MGAVRATQTRDGSSRWGLRTRPIWARLLALLLIPLLVVGALSWKLASAQLGQEQASARIEPLVRVTQAAGDLSNQILFEEYVRYAELELPKVTNLPYITPILRQQVSLAEGVVNKELRSVLPDRGRRSLWWVTGALRQVRSLAAEPKIAADKVLDAYGALVDRIDRVGERATETMTADGVGTSGALPIVRDAQAFNDLDLTNSALGDVSGLMMLYEGTEPARRPAVNQQIFGTIAVLASDIAALRQSGSPAMWRIWETKQAPHANEVVATTRAFADGPLDAAPNLAVLFQLAGTSGAVEQSIRTSEQQAGGLITTAAIKMAQAAQRSLDVTMGLVLLLVMATVALTFLLYRGLRNPMSDLAERARRFSEGDFTIPHSGRLPTEIAEVSAALDNAIRNFDQLKTQADALATGELSHQALQHAVPGKLGESLFHSVTQVSELQQRLVHEARHDALTGLYNRRAAIEALSTSLAEPENTTGVGVMFIDLDAFKQINDVHGHRAGDEVLAITAQRLQARVRPSDRVCRLGGDEFVVLIGPGTTVEESRGLAGRLIAALEAPIRTAAATVRLSASAGIAMSDPARAATSSSGLLAEADAAVYQAKAEGQGNIRVFDRQMRLARDADNEMARQLSESLTMEGDLHLVYQPTVQLPDGRCRSLEALCRWDRPGHGPIAPDVFIATAERSDLIIELDRWVLDQTCRQLAEWKTDPDLGALALQVNISGRHLGRGILVPDVLRALEAHSVPAAMLIIELTETSVVERPDLARDELNELRSHGIKIALDDFGTGYTSITQLGRVAVDILKIDRSFLVSDEGDGDRGPVIGLVIDVAHSMGMTVVAEGVEVEPHLNLLSALGCDMAQGYYLARPMPGEDLRDWIRGSIDHTALARLSSV
jgi:diguanylate cyclase (GGDEF)-like protein